MDPGRQKAKANLEHRQLVDLVPKLSRLSRSCHKKFIPPKYHEAELTKGEAICLDRCVAKFMEVHDRIGKKLMTSMQDEGAMKQMAGAQR